MTDIAPASAGSTHEDASKRLARRHKALETIFGGKFLHTFLSPYMVLEDHVIECPVGIRFYKKDFQYLSKQLYLEYQYRSWRGFSSELLDKYATIITAKLAAIDTLMQNNINRLHKLLDQQGHKADLTLWPAVYTTDVPIIAAQARAYIGVLAKMDRLYCLSGTANLLGVIDSSQRADVEFTAKKAVRAFRSILQTEVTRLYREAERIMAEQHSAGKVDVAMAAVVQQQGQDIAEFDKSSQQDNDDDPTMDLKGADPSQVIDSAAAAAAAGATAAGAMKRPRTTKVKAEPAPAATADSLPSSSTDAPMSPAAAA
jgi:hypothetical protein